jgi:hypothetical protein
MYLYLHLLSYRYVIPFSVGLIFFARGFLWVWNLVADIEGGTQAEGVWE